VEVERDPVSASKPKLSEKEKADLRRLLSRNLAAFLNLARS